MLYTASHAALWTTAWGELWYFRAVFPVLSVNRAWREHDYREEREKLNQVLIMLSWHWLERTGNIVPLHCNVHGFSLKPKIGIHGSSVSQWNGFNWHFLFKHIMLWLLDTIESVTSIHSLMPCKGSVTQLFDYLFWVGFDLATVWGVDAFSLIWVFSVRPCRVDCRTHHKLLLVLVTFLQEKEEKYEEWGKIDTCAPTLDVVDSDVYSQHMCTRIVLAALALYSKCLLRSKSSRIYEIVIIPISAH